MKTFAIIDNTTVFNLIVADSIETAQEIYPGKECIEYLSDQENKPIIGLKYVDGVFEQPVVQELENVAQEPVVESEEEIVETTEEPTE